MTERLQSVKDLAAEALGVNLDQIRDDLAYGDIPEWDSMGHMNVMMLLEEQFGVEITTENIARLVNIPAILVYLQEQNHA